MSHSADLPLAIVTYHLPEAWLAKLKGRCRLLIAPEGTPGLTPSLRAHLPEAQGLFTTLIDRIDATLLNQAPHLRVVSNMAVGVDNIDVEACTHRGIPVGNTPGVLTDATADMALALLLTAARGIPTASQDARQGRWGAWSPTGWLGKDLRGATLGIVGLGNIGKAIAERAAAFHLHIVYTSRSPKPQAEHSLELTFLPFHELLRQSDFVVLAVDLNPQTRGMMDEQAFRLMKPSAVLVNIARGAVVQTEALLRALQEGWIAAAALDVTDPEPLPPDHPLYQLPNCLITPHIASATEGTRRAMAELACENLLAGLEGRRLPHCVNPDAARSRS